MLHFTRENGALRANAWVTRCTGFQGEIKRYVTCLVRVNEVSSSALTELWRCFEERGQLFFVLFSCSSSKLHYLLLTDLFVLVPGRPCIEVTSSSDRTTYPYLRNRRQILLSLICFCVPVQANPFLLKKKSDLNLIDFTRCLPHMTRVRL